jgi:hypothetical protein
MNRIVIFAIMALLASCTTGGQLGERDRTRIATYDVRTHDVTGFQPAMFRDRFPDGRRIENIRIERQRGNFYLLRTGARDESSIPGSTGQVSCRNSRILLLDDGRGQLSLRPSSDEETCDGHNCQQCSFREGGGCNCDRTGDISLGFGYCDHSITRTRRDLIIIRAFGAEQH